MQIIHGENQVQSREYFLTLKHKISPESQLIELDGALIGLPELVTSAGSSSLFGISNVVFIENIFSRKNGSVKDQLVEYLALHPESEIFVWEPKDVTAQLKQFPASLVKKFDLIKYLFQYLDNFNFQDLNSTLETTPAEQVLSLLARQIHRLIIVKSGFGNYPSWQKTKLNHQSGKYSLEKLTTLQKSLLDIDYQNKNSALPYNLAVALELWTVSALQ